MSPLVSVIVPVYKVEDCLVRCLDSLCVQSLRNIEIIVVDDDSPDRCGEICNDYAKKDARFFVIHHLENKGLSEARNTGIAHAKGEYLMFVDSDDYVHKDFCKLPYECAVRNQVDLVMFRFDLIHNNKSSSNNQDVDAKHKTVGLLKSGYRTKMDALELLLNNNLGVGQGAWNKLYRKSMFEEISFPSGYLFEDVGTMYKTILRAHSIYFLNESLYYYYYSFRPGSITTSRTQKGLHDWIELTLQQYRDLVAWQGHTWENLELYLQEMAMVYCINKKRDLSDPNYMFCMQTLRSCKKVPTRLTNKRKILFLLLKYAPALFELTCTLLGKKYC